jgi:formylglycine-generating enzyme required for sulfatase activity
MSKLVGKKEIIVIVISVALTTLGIKAADIFTGDNTGDTENNGCGVDMAYVVAPGGGFCIDKYEVSASEDCPHTDPASQSDTRFNLNDKKCEPVSKPGKIPWRFVSQDQAVLACAKAGKRLPTNEEWFAAALGTPDLLSGWGINDCQVDENWDDQPGATGRGINCVSAAGAFDMIGNVWEWVSGTVSDGEYEGRALPPPGYVKSTDGHSFPAETDDNTGDKNYYNDYFWLTENGLRGIARGRLLGQPERGRTVFYVYCR